MFLNHAKFYLVDVKDELTNRRFPVESRLSSGSLIDDYSYFTGFDMDLLKDKNWQKYHMNKRKKKKGKRKGKK